MKISKFLLLSIVIGGLATSCEKAYVLPEPVTPLPPPCDTCATPTIFFSTDIYPLFNANGCMDCHGSQPPTFNTAASAYSGLVPAFVTAGSPSTSELYITVSPGGTMTSYGYPFPAADLAKLSTWINEGAQNN